MRAFLRKIWMLFAGERERNDYVVQYTKYFFALIFGRKNWIRAKWPGGQQQSSKHIAVFVHFDPQGIVHEFVLHYLGELAKADRRIIFISNSPKFPKTERAKLQGKVETILWRRNKGYDFGAYADGIKFVTGRTDIDMDSLLLCNDSVYGPVYPLQPLLAKMSAKEADMWALTDSWDTRYHLQSYFLLFHKKVLDHKFFAKRWKKYVHVQSKSWVIRKHEIGLTAEVRKANLTTKSLFRYRDLLSDFIEQMEDSKILTNERIPAGHRNILGQIFEQAQKGSPLNSSHFFWDQLLLSGYPFIKREVLQGNPMGLPSLYKWEQLLKEISSYDTELINDHLETVMRGRFM
ncbi:Alpha-L-Rha alpha-1,2-L-rhamnosyltransferase/alpha-L-Rha alpha-1,3-L-rhamnosyltransferase [hydrothermal vent metagenome]|uniref:Alpha-L-Rha alpha-1,2-L-rhamnosyltransferase/alpha-L-Rha alpha-1,3-L-rhamnosyltransferase n=1 Tax=hydrothermal vent metagenome TaxID=652676 RepID=A0A3B0RFK4_9ZZZZ